VNIIAAMKLKVKICEALGLDPNKVARIVIDIGPGTEPLDVQVTMFGDDRLLEIEWNPEVMKVEVDNIT
jgi:hypothetical protein